MKITVLNFSHPLTDAQLNRIAQLLEVAPEQVRVVDVATQFDMEGDLAVQVAALVGSIQLPWEDLRNKRVIVNLPGHATAAATLLAQWHGQTGHFPHVLLIRRAQGDGEELYEVGEILDLWAIRDKAREGRLNPNHW